MSRLMVEKRLSEVSGRLKRLGEDLRIAEEQLRQFADEADEARLRAIVADSPAASREHRDAQRHAEAMTRHRNDVVAEIAKLERTQDELLDELLETGAGSGS